MKDFLDEMLKLNDVSIDDIDVKNIRLSQSMTDITKANQFKRYEVLLNQVINSSKRISIFPDYDCDGICSGSVLYLGLRILGVPESRINLIVPDRNIGYGFSEKYFDKLGDTEVLMTTDNGINCQGAFYRLLQKGMIVLCSDHHLQEHDLVYSDRIAVVDPNIMNDNTEFKGISGTCLIWKLLLEQAKMYYHKQEIQQILQLIDLVGLSTVTDVMPLIKENRKYVNLALDIMNENDRWKDVRLSLERSIQYDDLGWFIGPMMNSESRMFGKPDLAFKMLIKGYDNSGCLSRLMKINDIRKGMINRITNLDSYHQDGSIGIVNTEQIYIDELNLDVNLASYAGIIASRIVGSTKKPSIVIVKNHDGYYHGSARSVSGFNLIDDLNDKVLKDNHFGIHGHAGAAGVSFPIENAEVIINRLKEIFDNVTPKNDTNDVPNLNDFNFDSILRVLKEYGPFGNHWSVPNLKISSYEPTNNAKLIGRQHNVFKDEYLCNGQQIEIIDFDYAKRNHIKGQYDLIGTVCLNHWKDTEKLQFNVIDVERNDNHD